MKSLLRLSGIIEAPTGLGLLAAPALVVRLLLGDELQGAGIPLGRIAGVALLALSIACWLASSDTESCTARGVVSAMVVYNLGAALVLGAAGLGSRPVGIALWPAVILHAVMTVWCVTNLFIRLKSHI